MNKLKIRIAERIFEVHHSFDKLPSLCIDYMEKENIRAQAVIKIQPSDIELERKLAEQTDINERGKISSYSDAYLECSSVYRKIADYLLDYGVLLMHGASVAVNGKAYVFLAKSGVGKTTHIKNWIKSIPDVTVINGDKPLIDSNNILVYGTPWSGKEGLNTNTAIPLSGLCLLERGEKNIIERIPFPIAVNSILQYIYTPDTPKAFLKITDSIYKLKDIPCYKLKCNMEKESAAVAYNFMREYDV